VPVKLSGTAAASASTDSSGNFGFTSLGAGNYTVAPGQAGYVFTPVSVAVTFTAASAALTQVAFTGTASSAASYSIAGTVSGSVAAGVTITLNGTNVGSTVTDSSGNYTFTGVVSGTYTVNASLGGYTFNPPLIVSVSAADSSANNFTSKTALGDTLAFTALSPLPQATVGSPYSSSVIQSITGGSTPYRFESGAFSGGTPPLGMIINPNGNLTGTPSVPGQYSFSVCALDSAGDTSPCKPTSILVVAATTTTPNPVAPTAVLTASPSTIAAGGSTLLQWSSTNATSCTAGDGWTGSQPISGTFTVSPATSTTYVLTCDGPDGSIDASVLVTVYAGGTPPPAPTISLSASPSTIPDGGAATLTWTSTNATSCVGSGGWLGAIATSGTSSVSPTSTTKYSLVCSNSAGYADTSATIIVDSSAPPPVPTVTLTASPTTIKSGNSTTLSWTSGNATSCAASGGWTGKQGTSGTLAASPTSTTTYTLTCTGKGGTAKSSSTVTVNGSQPASGTSWIYYNGNFDWPGDWPFMAATDYADTGGNPMSGGADLKITLTGQFGGWIPWAQNFSFNSAGYTKLTFALKPTVANQSWSIAFVKVGDIPVGITLNVLNYGPAPVAGQWATYTIPLSDLGVLGDSIYKFVLQDQTGMGYNVWYVDNVGFVP